MHGKVWGSTEKKTDKRKFNRVIFNIQEGLKKKLKLQVIESWKSYLLRRWGI